jgi:hypothetical protein
MGLLWNWTYDCGLSSVTQLQSFYPIADRPGTGPPVSLPSNWTFEHSGRFYPLRRYFTPFVLSSIDSIMIWHKTPDPPTFILTFTCYLNFDIQLHAASPTDEKSKQQNSLFGTRQHLYSTFWG